MPFVPDDPNGMPIDLSRPRIDNPDGSFSTERTITVEADGQHYLIPTIVGGKQLGNDQAIAAWRAGTNTPVGAYPTAAAAESAAVGRSSAIGQVRSPGRFVPDSESKLMGGNAAERAATNLVGSNVEPMLALGSGAVAAPLAGLAGLAGTMIPGPPGQGADWAGRVQRGMTYEPRTEGGKAALDVVSYPFRKLSEAAGAADAKIWEKTGSPALGSVVSPVTDAALNLLPVKGLGKAKGLIPERVPGVPESPVLTATRKAAQDAGYITPPERGLPAAAAGLAGKARVEKIISEKNETNATAKLSQEVGLPENAPLDEHAFATLKNDAGVAYDKMTEAAGPRLEVTTEFRDAINDALSKVNASIDVNPSLASAQKILKGYQKRVDPPRVEPKPGTGGPSIYNTIEKAAVEQPGLPISRTLEQAAQDSPGVKGYGQIGPPPSMPVTTVVAPTLETGWVRGQISQLRKTAKDDYRKGESHAGDARMGVANQLENLIEANLESTGQQALVSNFRDARKRFAQIYLLEDIVKPDGRVSLPKLASLAATPRYKGVLTGEFKTAADFAGTFRKAAQKGVGEALPRLSVFDGMFALGSLAAGHPVAALTELGGRLAIPEMARRGMLQNRYPSQIPSPP